MHTAHHAFHRPKTLWAIIIFLLVLGVGVRYYPPLMILGLDVLVVVGIVLLVTGLSHLWKHEIERLGKLMEDAEDAAALAPVQREEYEQYQILTSVSRSMAPLKRKKKLSGWEKEQLRYLKKQERSNEIKLFKRMLHWNSRAFFKRGPHHPTLAQNLSTILKEPRFFPVRMLGLVWLIATLLAFWVIFH